MKTKQAKSEGKKQRKIKVKCGEKAQKSLAKMLTNPSLENTQNCCLSKLIRSSRSVLEDTLSRRLAEGLKQGHFQRGECPVSVAAASVRDKNHT